MLFNALFDTLDSVEYAVGTKDSNSDPEAQILALRSGGDSTTALRAILAPDLQASIPEIDSPYKGARSAIRAAEMQLS